MSSGPVPHRWRLPVLFFVAGVLWLAWAWPRFSPASRFGLRTDRAGYVEMARRVAETQGFDLRGWRGFAHVEVLPKNQELHQRMPGDAMARIFPDAEVVTEFRAPSGPGTAKITLRTDGRPLSWKLTGAPMLPGGARDDTGMAHKAMETMTGDDVSNYKITSEGAAGGDGMSFQWKRIAPNSDMPQTGVQVSVKNGAVWQVNTDFRFPDSVAREIDGIHVLKIAANVILFLLIVAGVALPVFRDGGASAARALKDPSVIRIAIAAGLASAAMYLNEWDVLALSVGNTVLSVLILLLGAAFMGLIFYLTGASTALSAWLQVKPVRGFRLLGTRAFYSRVVGAELLGGWLVAPAIAGAPLLVSALMRAPLYKTFDDDFILSRMPVFDSVMHGFGAPVLMILVFFGVVFPLALRFTRPGGKRNFLIGLIAVIAFLALDSPFRSADAANIAGALADAALMLWLYTRFGVLGAVSGSAVAQILICAGLFAVQPGRVLQGEGWGAALAAGAIGLAFLAAAAKGPEVVDELYGDSGVRGEARSRREELLAEFNVARSAQQRMLPAVPPVLKGYTIAASCEPAREVGGDLYDFLRLGDGRWGIAVADVSGKGVPAALYMTLTKGLLCAAAQDSEDPRWILAAVNRHLKSVTKRKMFVTMAFAILDPGSRRMDYVRAGHNPAVWRRAAAGETRLLGGAGIGLGIAAPALFGKTLAVETLDLAPGDALVFYSDGLTEAMNKTLEQFGEERLMAAVERADGMHAAAARDSILGEVRRFLNGVHAQDDLTIAVLRVDGEQGDN